MNPCIFTRPWALRLFSKPESQGQKDRAGLGEVAGQDLRGRVSWDLIVIWWCFDGVLMVISWWFDGALMVVWWDLMGFDGIWWWFSGGLMETYPRSIGKKRKVKFPIHSAKKPSLAYPKWSCYKPSTYPWALNSQHGGHVEVHVLKPQEDL